MLSFFPFLKSCLEHRIVIVLSDRFDDESADILHIRCLLCQADFLLNIRLKISIIFLRHIYYPTPSQPWLVIFNASRRDTPACTNILAIAGRSSISGNKDSCVGSVLASGFNFEILNFRKLIIRPTRFCSTSTKKLVKSLISSTAGLIIPLVQGFEGWIFIRIHPHQLSKLFERDKRRFTFTPEPYQNSQNRPPTESRRICG